MRPGANPGVWVIWLLEGAFQISNCVCPTDLVGLCFGAALAQLPQDMSEQREKHHRAANQRAMAGDFIVNQPHPQGAENRLGNADECRNCRGQQRRAGRG